MKYIGIDLGTTNSVISMYDGTNTTVYKSPEQNDITPSAIYFDKRGNKYVGARAYNNAPMNPENSALLFKRFMGTSTKIHIKSLEKSLLPEECSADILKTLFGYLPEEIRTSDDIGTVITVPAAFSQMQKDATMQAAEMAGIGKVALMQEPVAAVMSIIKAKPADGIFLIYDFGGGTLDIAIAEGIGGKVNLLSHNGIAMCGGRDFDRALMDTIVRPWLLENFDLPEDLAINPKYKKLLSMATLAAEKAKIELSSRENAIISLQETELNIQDLSGEDIYLDIPITRDEYNPLIKNKLKESINATRESLDKAGLSANDIERMVFIGGPTQYKPLRDYVSYELGIQASMDVNPMTAVSEGAAIYAESIDWTNTSRTRKKSNDILNIEDLGISFKYNARTSNDKAKFIVVLNKDIKNCELQIDSIDTGWTSGRIDITNHLSVNLSLKNGENTFKYFIYQNGRIVKSQNNIFTITKTSMVIDAIPSSSSIGIEVQEKIGGVSVLDYLVRNGDKLPAKGKRIYKSTESLRAGSNKSIKFKIWEGDIENPVSDNNFIGLFEIKGTDFDSGIIQAGAELITEFEMLDSGLIVINVSVPSIGNSFNSDKNFYSRTSAQIDYASKDSQDLMHSQLEELENRINQIEDKIDDKRINSIKEKINNIVNNNENNAETTKQIMDSVQEAKKELARIRQDNISDIRMIDLDLLIEHAEDIIIRYGSDIENKKYEALKTQAYKNLDNSSGFQEYFNEIRDMIFPILFRQDSFVIDMYHYFKQNPYLFTDKQQYNMLIQQGDMYLQDNEINKLRSCIISLIEIKNHSSREDDILQISNIIRG